MPADLSALTIDRIDRASGVVRLPGSKSISNRTLLLSALAHGQTTLSNLLVSDDTHVMREALKALGVQFADTESNLCVGGCGGRFPVREARLFLGNAGTAFRSLTAALAFSGGRYQLDGSARMHERPIGDLVGALNSLGARISYLMETGFPPLVIEAAGRLTGDRVSIDTDISSQFLSGLLMAAPLIAPDTGLRIDLEGPLVSAPYVDLTVGLMRRFGARVVDAPDSYLVARGGYQSPGRFLVEGDASSASYFLALGAIAGGPVRVEGVGKDSSQGDVRFAELLTQMGARIELGDSYMEARAAANPPLRAVNVDCNDIPDAAMTLAIVALFADAPSVLRNIGSWRVKETDRIAAMATELRKVGATIDEGNDWMRVTPPKRWREATVDTYDDHRIAMCLSLVAAGGVPVHIHNPQCVAKTFPDYFDRLLQLVGR